MEVKRPEILYWYGSDLPYRASTLSSNKSMGLASTLLPVLDVDVEPMVQMCDLYNNHKKIMNISSSEWLLQEAMDIEMTGYEVNRSWWEGEHSIPHFIKISKNFFS